MLDIQNKDKFDTAVQQAIANKVSLNNEFLGSRWHNAIQKAITEIKENPFVHFEDGELIILSRQSNRVRTLTVDNCSEMCEAFAFGHPCSHQAIAYIWTLYQSLLNPPTAKAVAAASLHDRLVEQSNALYLKNTVERKVERIGSVRI